MNTINYQISVNDVIDIVGEFIEKIDISSSFALTAEQKLIALIDYFNTGVSNRFIVAPAIVADELLLNFYDRLTSKFVTRMSADRAVEEYKRRQIIIEKNRE